MPSTGTARSPFSAAEQGLGYIYQARLALLKILSLPENTDLLLEKDDDIEFVSEDGRRSLASLKHKAAGNTLTDLSTDFWKSVRIWLAYYLRTGRTSCDARFVLFTTARISEGSLLARFAGDQSDDEGRASAAQGALDQSQSQSIREIKNELGQLSEDELEDFYGRISIIDESPRITDIPALIDQLLRTIRRNARPIVFERLEGWWMDLIIKILSGERIDPIRGYEVSDKLSALADEYRSDNLPITFRNSLPPGHIDAANDRRVFVEQLRALQLSSNRIQKAIVDYYRAFEQRSSWARESLLVSGEIEEYEDRLVDEWQRYKEVLFERIVEASAEEACLAAGRELFNWAELQTGMLRIRERVTEPYVVRGAFHILANERPTPRVHWHPRFLERLGLLLGVAA